MKILFDFFKCIISIFRTSKILLSPAGGKEICCNT